MNVGYDQFIQRDESVSEHIDTLLDALTTVKQKHPSDIQADIVTRLYIDFICMCVHELLNNMLGYLAWYNDKDTMYTL